MTLLPGKLLDLIQLCSAAELKVIVFIGNFPNTRGKYGAMDLSLSYGFGGAQHVARTRKTELE